MLDLKIKNFKQKWARTKIYLSSDIQFKDSAFIHVLNITVTVVLLMMNISHTLLNTVRHHNEEKTTETEKQREDFHQCTV